jgi:hypothetical protein
VTTVSAFAVAAPAVDEQTVRSAKQVKTTASAILEKRSPRKQMFSRRELEETTKATPILSSEFCEGKAQRKLQRIKEGAGCLDSDAANTNELYPLKFISA